MIENDDGGPSRSAFPFSFLKVATRAEVSKKAPDEGSGIVVEHKNQQI
jgi:hypothetical protein